MRFLVTSLILTFYVSLSFSQLNISLVGQLDVHTMHNQGLNDIWGYVDELGNEYALVGGTKGTSVVDISTPSNPIEVFFEPGMESIWRDLKTFGDYAYVTTEALNGLLIIDLSPLPASTSLPVSYYTGPTGQEWQSAHNLFIDSLGYAYIYGANRGNGGVIILDVFTDPMNPIEVGEFDNWYVHDGMTDNDTMYLGHISDGFISMVDVQDKANPVLLGTQFTPSNFSHNVWSKDGQYAFSTDEVSGGYIGAFDISDPSNMIEIDRIQSSPGAGVVPHNAHVYGNYLVTSYYSDGVTIHDISQPHNLVEVGHYDTYPGQTTGYEGCWGAFPFFPSGTLIASDRSEGLFVLSPTYAPAAYLEGTVTNALTSNPVDLVDVQIVGHNQVDQTSVSGFYATGIANGGTYDVTYSKVGYMPQTVNVTLVNGIVTTQDVQLEPIPPYDVTITVLEEGTNNPIAGANVLLDATLISHPGLTNGLGEEVLTLFYQENYAVTVGKWGYITHCESFDIDSLTGGITIYLSPGIYDDFTFDFGWSVVGDAATGMWERGIPNGTSSGTQSATDSDNDCHDYCFVTGNAPVTHSDADDVDDGTTTLISPVMDLSGYSDPYLNYERWYFCFHGILPPGDSLEVFVSNGTDYVRVDVQTYDTTVHFEWIEKSIRLLDFLPVTSTMQVFYTISDIDPDINITEGGVDHFFIVEEEELTISELSSSVYSLFPNPAQKELYVKGIKANTDYQIVNTQGEVLVKGKLSSTSNRIDLQALSNGVYFIQLNEQIKKFVITK